MGTPSVSLVERAAEETGLTADLLETADLGKLCWRWNKPRRELSKPQEQTGHVVKLKPEEREAALTWLREPNLIGRLRGGVPSGGHHRRGDEYARCVSGGRVAQARSAAGGGDPEHERSGQDDAHGRGAVILPGRRASQILGHDRPEPLLPGRDEPEK